MKTAPLDTPILSLENRDMSDPTYKQLSAKLPNGGIVRIAVPMSQAMQAEDVGGRVPTFDLDRVRDAIEGVGALVADALKSVKPTKASVEFGFTFELQSGNVTALFVQGNVNADLKISLEWGSSDDKSA